jgi:uncharacterized protein
MLLAHRSRRLDKVALSRADHHTGTVTPRGQHNPHDASGKTRLITLDFIRGIAVLGILYANIVAFSQPMVAAVWPQALSVPMDDVDRIIWLGQFLLIDGKMRGLFAMLFGAGLVLFTEAKGTALQWRRLAILALFGMAHYFLLFRGDILFSYAMCGMVNLMMRAYRLHAPAALALGIIMYLIGAVLQGIPFLDAVWAEQRALAVCADGLPCAAAPAVEAYWLNIADELKDVAKETQVMSGGFGGILAYNLGEERYGLLWGAILSLFESLPAMLIGIGLYRGGLFTGRAGPRLLPWGLAGIVLGLVLTWPLALVQMRSGDPYYLSLLISLGPAQAARLPMVLGMIAVLAWLAPRAAGSWLGQRLIAAGRMAFSSYLGMSLVMAVVFQGWGFGLFGQLGRVGMLVPVGLGCLAMLLWSKPWLDRFAYGPLEWLWRCLTYRRFFPLKRDA